METPAKTRVLEVANRTAATDPLTSVRDTLRDARFDEIIVSTLPKTTAKWLRRDLTREIENLGLPLTVVTPPATGEGFADTKAFDIAMISLGLGRLIRR